MHHSAQSDNISRPLWHWRPFHAATILNLHVGALAHVGLVAPIDVVVPLGNTGLDPSQTSFFQVGNLLFVEFGKALSFLILLRMTSLRSLMVVVTSLSLAISYPTLAATPHMFVNAYKNVLGVVVETNYSFLEADKDPSKFVVIVVAALVVESAAHVAAKEEEKKEEAAKEPDDGIAHPLGIWSANAGFYASRYKRFGNLWYINGALQAFIRHQNQDLRISFVEVANGVGLDS
ncbi:hypothetical protein JHK87_024960 [Glycine soja]|nr:hypothetical protein JHK87_024960 [Glycine soja]